MHHKTCTPTNRYINGPLEAPQLIRLVALLAQDELREMKFTKAYVTSGWSKVEGGPATDLIMICPQRGGGVMDVREGERR